MSIVDVDNDPINSAQNQSVLNKISLINIEVMNRRVMMDRRAIRLAIADNNKDRSQPNWLSINA